MPRSRRPMRQPWPGVRHLAWLTLTRSTAAPMTFCRCSTARLPTAALRIPRLPRLKGVYRRTWYANQLLLRRAARAVSALSAEGIDALVLGGRPWGCSITAISVPGPWTTRASPCARRRGSNPAECWLPRTGGLLTGTARRRLPSACRRADADCDAAAWAPCASDELLRICVRGISWTSRPRSARWIADALVIVGGSAAAIDWERFVRRAAEARVAPHLAVVLDYVSETFEAPIPQRVLSSLGRAMTPGGCARFRVTAGRALIHGLHSP